MFHMKPDGGRCLDVLGTSVHVVVAGGPASGGVTPIVLCGGLGATWHDWIDVTDALVDAGHTVVVIERPGFGGSEPLPSDRVPTVSDEARRILGVLDALSLPGPAVLVGHSIAGFYVEGVARLFPDRTAGLVLLDSSVEASPGAVVPARFRVPIARAFARIASATGVQALVAGPVRHMVMQAIPPDGYTPARTDELGRIYRRPSYLAAATVEYAVYADLAVELHRLRISTSLPSVPTVVAAAHTGRPTPWGARWLRKQRRLARYLHGRFDVVSPSHHHAMIDQPAQVFRLVDSVADSSSSAPAAAESTLEE